MAGEGRKEVPKIVPDGEVLWRGKLQELGTEEQKNRVAENVCETLVEYGADRATCVADIKGLMDIYIKGADRSVDANIKLVNVPRLEISKEKG